MTAEGDGALAFFPVSNDAMAGEHRRKDPFFRPSGARDIYSNLPPIAYAMGYDLSPAARAVMVSV
jgi:hypothetical protein